MRSLRLPVGFSHSSFAYTAADPAGTTFSSRTSEVFPTASRIFMKRSIRRAVYSEDGFVVTCSGMRTRTDYALHPMGCVLVQSLKSEATTPSGCHRIHFTSARPPGSHTTINQDRF